MKIYVDDFLHDESGASSLDWVVLTGILVGTGLAVINTVSGGIETAAVDSASQLRGQVVQRGFAPANLCASGIDGVRAQEAARVASGGIDPVDIDTWLPTYARDLSDTALILERERLANTTSDDDRWSRNDTVQGLLECDMARRGI